MIYQTVQNHVKSIILVRMIRLIVRYQMFHQQSLHMVHTSHQHQIILKNVLN